MKDKLVMTVDWVEARITEPPPPRLGVPQLVVTAIGTVPTLGWTHARFVPRSPRRGAPQVIELDFVAEPPAGLAGDVVSAISASGLVAAPPDGVREVLVHAAEDNKQVPIAAVPAGKR
jgi:hypothetical protein